MVLETQTILGILNIVASIFWIDGAWWFLPTMAGAHTVVPGLVLFMTGVLIFGFSLVVTMSGAFKAGAPVIMKAIMVMQLVALLLFTIGLIMFFPAVGFATTALNLFKVALAIFTILAGTITVLTFMGCKAAGSGYLPLLSPVVQTMGVLLLEIGTFAFGSMFGAHAFCGAVHLVALAQVLSLAIPPPSSPPQETANQKV